MRTTLIAAGLLGLAASPMACKRNGDSNAPDGECGGLCGRGTRCDGSVCVVDYSQDICSAPVESTKLPDVPIRPPIESWGTCQMDRSQLPKKHVPLNDKDIPQYDPSRARKLDWNEGEEQLSGPLLDSAMRDVEYKINDCLAIAACYNNGSLKGGRMEMQISLSGKTGRVDSVSVAAPADLQIFGIVPCVRKAIYEHQFPTYNGPPMNIKYAIEIGE